MKAQNREIEFKFAVDNTQAFSRLLDHLDLPETALSRRVDPLLDRLGRAVSWLWLVLLLIIVVNVTLRYLFGEGRIELEEIQWHIYSLGFLLGLSYAYQSDSHIRVDVDSLVAPVLTIAVGTLGDVEVVCGPSSSVSAMTTVSADSGSAPSGTKSPGLRSAVESVTAGSSVIGS